MFLTAADTCRIMMLKAMIKDVRMTNPIASNLKKAIEDCPRPIPKQPSSPEVDGKVHAYLEDWKKNISPERGG
jgi:hypothetical protein